MATRIEGDMPAAQRQVYPWSDWQDGATWEVFVEQDFFVLPENFRVQLYQRARKAGLKVRVHLLGERGRANGIRFQFYGHKKETP